MEQSTKTHPPSPAATGPEFPVRRTFLKVAPDGSLHNLRVHVSDDPGLDAAFRADGWDIVRAGDVSVRLKLES